MMLDLKLAKIRTTQNNIRRYRRLLETELTDLERQYIERRLSEERVELEALSKDTFPISFAAPISHPSASTNENGVGQE